MIDILKKRDFLSSKTSLLQFLPSNLSELINGRETVEYDGIRLKSSYLIDIVHTLLIKYYTLSKNDIKINFFNLSSTILQRKYGNRYAFYFYYLMENNIIEIVSEYLVGSKSKTYALTDITLKSEILRYRNSDTVLLKKHKKSMLDNEIKSINYSPIELDIRKKLIDDLNYVSIDMTKSINILNQIESSESKSKNAYSVESIKLGDIFYNFDDFGRMHTNFTILKSDIRKSCLYIEDESIEELDIRNSQPLFLALILSKNLENIDSEEYKFFKNCVIKGEIYKYFMDECDVYDKKSVKELIYKVLFGRNKPNKENKIFKSLFPSIYKFIRAYKKKKGDYRTLAYLLQRSESNFLFNKFVKSLYEEIDGIRLFTIHDSVSYPTKYSKKVKDIFDREIKKLIKDVE